AERAIAAKFLAGDAVVSEADLERIFNLKPLQTPEPPLATEHFTGLRYAGRTVFTPGGVDPALVKAYSFNMPGRVGMGPSPQAAFRYNDQASADGTCATCGKGDQK